MNLLLTRVLSKLKSGLAGLARRPAHGEAPAPVAQDEHDAPAAAPETAEPASPTEAAPTAPPPPEAPGDQTPRRQIVERFEAWLDEVLADENPPNGLDAQLLASLEGDTGAAGPHVGGSDLYSLWSAMIALTQETGLQGRAFKQLSEALAPTADLVRAVEPMLEAHRESLDAARQIAEDARTMREELNEQNRRLAARDAQEGMLDVLLDVRDRLVRGLETAHETLRHAGPEPSGGGRLVRWLSRKPLIRAERSREAAESLAKGYALALQRLDECLERLEVRPIRCVGRPFDPRTMTAVDILETTDAPEGVVLEVYRIGYEWAQKVHRPAEVKVARRPAPSVDAPATADDTPESIEETPDE